MRKTIHIILGLIILHWMYSCAVEQAPLGGPKDEISPEPDSLLSTRNEQVFFEKQDIKLVFNEWVTLKNANQIVVSPPLNEKISAKLKKKTLILSFDDDEKLLENTTYTINLGNAIVDYTVGNAMSNYTFVFSTGSYIDSLSIKGTIIDDFTGEPIENMLVSLYDNLQDTAFFTTRPLYFATTDEDGRYAINNVRNDSFRIYALDDKNVNYYRDQASESMGFYPEIVRLDTSFKKNVDFGMYSVTPALRITNKAHQYGALKMTFNQELDTLDYRFEPEFSTYESYQMNDSLFIWYRNSEERSIIIQTNPDRIDTIPLISSLDSTKYTKKVALQASNASGNKKLSVLDTLALILNSSIQRVDESLISISDTSKIPKSPTLLYNEEDPRKLLVKRNWKEGIRYELQLLPGAITNHFGVSHDTITLNFITSKQESLGEIIFELDSLNQDYQYLVELTKGKKTIKRIVRNKKSAKLSIKSLETGAYSTRITEDTNKNGRWDGGDFLLNKQSEQWISKSLESLKAGWTLEVQVNGSEFKK